MSVEAERAPGTVKLGRTRQGSYATRPQRAGDRFTLESPDRIALEVQRAGLAARGGQRKHAGIVYHGPSNVSDAAPALAMNTMIRLQAPSARTKSRNCRGRGNA